METSRWSSLARQYRRGMILAFKQLLPDPTVAVSQISECEWVVYADDKPLVIEESEAAALTLARALMWKM